MSWNILAIIKEFHKVFPDLDIMSTVDRLEKLEASLDSVPIVNFYKGQEMVDFFNDNYDFFPNEPGFDAGGIDKEFLLRVLEAINQKLQERDLSAIIHVYGGCAMMLTCVDSRRSWDFDFIFESKTIPELSKVLREIEDDFRMPPSAFDKTLGPLLAGHFKKNDTFVYREFPNLTVRLCTPEQLLAMKLFSARDGDLYKDKEDCIELCRFLGISNFNEMKKILYSYVKEESVAIQEKKRQVPGETDRFIREIEVALRE